MKRRTRITLALAAISLATLGGTYALVAEQVIPSTASSSAVAAPAENGAQSRVDTGRTLSPAVVHSQTRGS